MTQTQKTPDGRTPGDAYVETYLGVAAGVDDDFLAEAINRGDLIACPRCHFLHLPARPFRQVLTDGQEMGGREPAAEDGCDICPLVPDASRHLTDIGIEAEHFRDTAGRLNEARTERARLLFDLYLGASAAADALCWAAIGDGLEALRGRITGDGREVGDGQEAGEGG
ncbi:MAG: hypothetical protein JO250_15320 [Armatimonadetes bacterium]|nr:hypothetical protein [Armatimonadota bacterium]